MARIVNYTCLAHGKFKHSVRCGYGDGPAPKSIMCTFEGCTLTASRYSRFRDNKSRRALSVSQATYDRLVAYCRAQEISMGNLIDALTQDLGRTA